MSRIALAATTLALACLALGQGPGPSAPAKVIAPYLEDQTLAVVRVDLTRVDLDAIFAVLEKIWPGPDERIGRDLAEGKRQFKKWLGDFLKAGGKEVYVFVNLADIPDAPFYAVVPLGEGADAKAIAGLLIFGQAQLPETVPSGASTPGPFKVAEKIGNALVAGSRGQVARLKAAKPAERPEFAQAFAAVGEATLTAAVALSPDARRVFQETIPNLPKELGGGEMSALTKGVNWAALALDPPPKMSLRLVVQCADEAGAKGVSDLVAGLFKSVGELKEVKEFLPNFTAIAEMLAPKVQDDRLVLALDQKQMDALVTDLLTPALKRGRAQARQAYSMNSVGFIVKSCHIYAAGHQDQFPPDLEALLKLNVIIPSMLKNPARPDLVPAYIYLPPGLPLSKVTDPTKIVVVHENYDRWGEGIAVGFIDGRVKFIKDEQEFKKLLEATKAATQPK